jgi:hypothetical protein
VRFIIKVLSLSLLTYAYIYMWSEKGGERGVREREREEWDSKLYWREGKRVVCFEIEINVHERKREGKREKEKERGKKKEREREQGLSD